MLLQVYKGMLETVELVAVKRAQEESRQETQEFKAEIEILSRSHSPGTGCFRIGQRLDISPVEYQPTHHTL
jgi:hypothetical protein